MSIISISRHQTIAVAQGEAKKGPIAQSVEQLAFNQWVAGSNPARLI